LLGDDFLDTLLDIFHLMGSFTRFKQEKARHSNKMIATYQRLPPAGAGAGQLRHQAMNMPPLTWIVVPVM
jgi:hypothetical protein